MEIIIKCELLWKQLQNMCFNTPVKFPLEGTFRAGINTIDNDFEEKTIKAFREQYFLQTSRF